MCLSSVCGLAGHRRTLCSLDRSCLAPLLQLRLPCSLLLCNPRRFLLRLAVLLLLGLLLGFFLCLERGLPRLVGLELCLQGGLPLVLLLLFLRANSLATSCQLPPLARQLLLLSSLPLRFFSLALGLLSSLGLLPLALSFSPGLLLGSLLRLPGRPLCRLLLRPQLRCIGCSLRLLGLSLRLLLLKPPPGILLLLSLPLLSSYLLIGPFSQIYGVLVL
mmetsp:Transcript_43972/g.127158  ORF Transcript_43972/g.127158 Transcript_43972/m.127158 type:complete len:218 (-) Transcript_43972:1636-2289(-)